jgi:amino acid adenylation domain-containing protein
MDIALRTSFQEPRGKFDSNLLGISEQDFSLLQSWAGGHIPAEHQTIAHLLSDRSRHYADNIAVDAWDGELTYRQVDGYAAALAHHLQSQDTIHSGDYIILALRKSKWMPVAIFAVLRAGLVAVPVDISQPTHRLQTVRDDCQATTMVLSQGDHLDLSGIMMNVQLSQVFFESLPPSPMSTTITVRPHEEAFVFYTSGSTGRPKGIIHGHGSIVAALQHLNPHMNLHERERILHYASYAFDASVHEILSAFWTGGCLCIPSHENRADLEAYIRQSRVSWAVLTPVSISGLDPQQVPTLKTLVSTGESLPNSVSSRWAGSITLLNAFGPTEAGFCCTVLRLTSEWTKGSIGPIVNGQGWVVKADEISRLCPIGEPGELLLEGPALAHNYLNAPESTRQSFVLPPAWRQHFPGVCQRLYRTGDIVKHDGSGALVFLGRKDRLIKINGQRIELDEVQHHIDHCVEEGYDAAVIAVVPLGSQHTVLVVFVAPRSSPQEAMKMQSLGNVPSDVLPRVVELADVLHGALQKQLPSYMVPSFYLPVESIPLTSSGKRDRQNLTQRISTLTITQLAEAQSLDKDPKVAPRNSVEAELLRLWAKALSLPSKRVSIEDNFFRIGGDSIQAMRLVTQAREEGLHLSVGDVFKNPVLKDLAMVASRSSQPVEDIAAFSLLPPDACKDDLIQHAAQQCGVADSNMVEDIQPCTALQQTLLSATAKDTAANVDRTVYELHDHIDLDRLEAAFNEVARDEAAIMRARIVDLPVVGVSQVILDRRLPWTVFDGSVATFMGQDKEDRMGLGTSLNRFVVVRQLSSHTSKRFLVWTKHHSTYDGWSIALVLKRVQETYLLAAPSLRLTPYKSFLKRVLAVKSSDAERHWRNTLGDLAAPVFPPLPMSNFQPRSQSILEYETEPIAWSNDGFTAYTLIKAAWAIMMAQYTNSQDVLYGSVSYGRGSPSMNAELVAGPTMVVIPVRTIIDWKQSALELLQRLQDEAISMLPYEQLGFSKKVTGSRKGIQELLQALLVVQPISSQQLTDCAGELFTNESLNGKTEDAADMHNSNPYALMIECQFLPTDQLSYTLSFDNRVLNETECSRMLRHVEYLLHEICRNASVPLEALDRANPDDLREIWSWNVAPPPPCQSTVRDLIAKQMALRPDSMAVHAWDGRMTYSELDAASDRIASHLISRSTKGVVPLCFEKSLWTTVAMVGCIKSGLAAVALDINHPEERLRLIVQQTGADHGLCSEQSRTLATRIGLDSHTVVDPASVKSMPAAMPGPPPHIDPASPLFLVFTSGSTGTPKGVITTHSNFSSAVTHQQQTLGFTPTARVYDFSSYSFDAAWSNALHTLSAGGCLCIPSESMRQDDIAASMRDFRVTFADLTPSTLRLIEPADVPSLERILLGGEPLSQQDIHTWAPRVALRNVYGPAECTVTATASSILTTSASPHKIGRGVAFSTWVVEPEYGARLSPIGAIGELWLEGPLVGLGYYRDAPKTGLSFVEAPPWLLEGAEGKEGRTGRLYRTGDLVKYASDGTLSFVGRKDKQVKVRGQRLELGEVEHHVLQHFPGLVDTAAAVVETSHLASKAFLVAFLGIDPRYHADLTVDEEDPTVFHVTSELQAHISHAKKEIARVAPPYIVPDFFFPLKLLPTMPSGKLNRSRLQELGSALVGRHLSVSRGLAGTKKPPTDDAQRLLRRVMAKVLDIAEEEIGCDEDFFSLGGDSISAMRMAAQCRMQSFELWVCQIFANQTIERMSRIGREVPPQCLESTEVPQDDRQELGTYSTRP